MSVSHGGAKSYPVVVASQKFYSYSGYCREHGSNPHNKNRQIDSARQNRSYNKEYTIVNNFPEPRKPLSSYALGLLQFVKSIQQESDSFSIRSLLQAKPLESRDRLKAAIAELLKVNAIKEVKDHGKLKA